ncbi:MAG: glucose-6-phosphate isomerase [Alphaproteobacteria bacterium]
MPYVHLSSTCYAEAIGPGGLDRILYERMLDRTRPALEGLRKAHADGSMPLLRLPEARDDLKALEPVAKRFRDSFDHVVVLGTGGSSLGGKTLCALAGPEPAAPELHFMDNIDPHSFDALLGALDLARTGFLVISKSGSTAETLSQFLVCYDAVNKAAGGADVGAQFTAITEPGDNVLRRLATKFGMEVLDHDPGIGGRYSALSLVGLLPAMIAGLDAVKVREGAQAVLGVLLRAHTPDESEPVVGAAIAVTLQRENKIGATVLMPYVDRLADFGLWYRQLWAESLGKGGKGTTPIRALGTVDQHSQLQLYLDGPRDKMFTLIMLGVRAAGGTVDAALADDEALAYLSGKTMGDLMEAEQAATARTLSDSGRPTRIFRLTALDERTLGGLMMHFMLETIVAAFLMGVDPFDQPAVEKGKVLAREYLAKES